MTYLTIGIPTYNRNDLLAKLLSSIVNETFLLKNTLIKVLIADNSIDRLAECVYQDYKEKLQIEYIHIISPGIPVVRNAILNHVYEGYLLFLDDDVLLRKGMLNQTLNYINQNESLNAILLRKYVRLIKGSVVQSTYYDPAVSNSVADYKGDLITTALVINLNLWDGLYFNENLRFTGGSDYCFGLDAIDRGWNICYCAEAEVIEDYNQFRSSLLWSARRNFRYGFVQAMIHSRLREKKSLKMSFQYFFVSLGRAAKNLLKGDLKKSLLMLMRCIGVVAGISGLNFEEYAR